VIPSRQSLIDLAALFARLGVTAFGGPAAHIAMMRDEVVRRRRWLTDAEFLDLVGATNLIPGPNSTEMAIHIGYRRAGWRGLLVAGVCFIVPAMLIVITLAWGYVHYGTVPTVTALLYGVKPVLIAIVLQALVALGRTAVRTPLLAAVGLGALALFFRGTNEIGLLIGGGLVVWLLRLARRLQMSAWIGAAGSWAPHWAAAVQTAALAPPFDIMRMTGGFLKIGAVLYGSGYVLLAFLRAEFIVRLGWLTDRQLLDAVAIGQFTPGPVFTTAAFAGYVLGGLPAALLATAAIFTPAFIFVAATHPFIPRLRRSAHLGALLDGVNVASLALMAGVTWQLALSAIVDVPTAVVAAGSALILFRFRPNAAWIVLAGAVAGVAARALTR
jgi:chromate transporter